MVVRVQNDCKCSLPCNGMADWELQLLPLPSVRREYPIANRQPEQKSKFKIPHMASTECLSLSHHREVK